MAKPWKRKRGQKSPQMLLEKGLLTLAVGAALLLGSFAVGEGRPAMAAISLAMSMPAWWAIGIGVVLIAVSAFKQFTQKVQVFHSQPSKPTRPPPPASTIRALIDQAELACFLADAEGLPAPPGSAPSHSSNTPKLTLQTSPGQSVPNAVVEPPPANPWVPELFAALNAPQFEAVCETLFAQAGFQTRTQTLNDQGGMDIWLYSGRSVKPAAMVQCQHGEERPVSEGALQSFLEVMKANGVSRGTYATASSYSQEAVAYAKNNGINIMDSSNLLRLISRRSPEQQQALLNAAAASFSSKTPQPERLLEAQA